MKRRATFFLMVVAVLACSYTARGESPKEYKNRFMLMLDHAVHVNEYVRQRLGDKGLAGYAQAMAERNVAEAEKMTPPKKYGMMHPHFLLVLENIERSMFFAEKGDLVHYRHHQKMVRRELQLLEALADRERTDLYLWRRCR
jgi:hypothetical protein